MKDVIFKSVLAASILLISLLLYIFLPISFKVQLFFLIGALVLTGIPHGAVDHLVEEKNNDASKKTFNIVTFLIRYVSTILIYAFCWLILPEISLVLFLVISAWHFGETDISISEHGLTQNVMRFIWGVIALGMLLLNRIGEVTQILEKIISPNSWVIKYFLFLAENKFAFIGFLCAFLLLLFFTKSPKISLNYLLQIIFPFLIISAVSLLPILLGFTLYFAFWHSIIAFKTISKYIFINLDFERAFLKTWLKALPFTFLAFVFLISSFFLWQNKFSSSDPTMLIFIFISTITLPHLNVMHGMYSNKKA